MIATKRFVFLHLHKSGGTFVNEWLLRFFPDARELGYHLPRKLIPPPLAALPVIGLVRNPWSYYVSWHAFQATRRQPNALFQILSNGGEVGFEGTIRNMLELGGASALLDRIVGALPASYVGKGLKSARIRAGRDPRHRDRVLQLPPRLYVWRHRSAPDRTHGTHARRASASTQRHG